MGMGGQDDACVWGTVGVSAFFWLFSLPALLDELLFIIQRLANSASRSSRVGGYWWEVWCGRLPSGEGMGSEIDCLSHWKCPFLRA